MDEWWQDKTNVKEYNAFHAEIGGGGGIRTHGTREGTLVFETSLFNHSSTPPRTIPYGVRGKLTEAGQQGKGPKTPDMQLSPSDLKARQNH